MVTQLRDYRLADGEVDRFVEEWRTQLAPLRRACGFSVDGAWTVPDKSRFVWLLSHPGDWEAFSAADEQYFASPERAGFNPDPARLIINQRNVRLDEVDLP